MQECHVVPCYKMFLKELKDILSSTPINISLLSSPPFETFPNVDIEHITNPTTTTNSTNTPVSSRHNLSSNLESVSKSVQTNIRMDTRKENPMLSPRVLKRQVVCLYSSFFFALKFINNYTNYSTFPITIMVEINFLQNSVHRI